MSDINEKIAEALGWKLEPIEVGLAVWIPPYEPPDEIEHHDDVPDYQGAMRDLIEKFALGDFAYQIRESADCSELTEGQSSWEHPDVVRFGECIEILKELAGAE